MWFISNGLWPGSLCFHWRGDWSYSGQIPHQQVWKKQKPKTHHTSFTRTASGCRVPLPCSPLMKNRKTHLPKYSQPTDGACKTHGGLSLWSRKIWSLEFPRPPCFPLQVRTFSNTEICQNVVTGVWCIKKTDLYKLNLCLSLAVASAQRNKTIISLFQQISSSFYR